MDNLAFEAGDDTSPTLDPANYLSANELTISSNSNSSGISSSRETPSPIPIEPVLTPLHRLPKAVQIDRNILLTKDFYPISKSSRKSESEDAEAPAGLFTEKSTWRQLTDSAKQCLPCTSSTSCSPCSLLFTVFPILKWLSNYQVRDNLLYDIIAGVTIFALHIPQGLAYGRLAGAEPINGLYVSMFPVAIYALFGGSRQVSIGTFAVISIACRDVVEQVLSSGDIVDGDSDLGNETASNITGLGNFFFQTAGEVAEKADPITAIQVLTSLCLLVGIIQFIIGLLRLGILATLLSDPIVSAFCVAAAVHVFTSQVFSLVGIDSAVGKDEPYIPFEVIRSWYRLISRIQTVNPTTICLSLGTITVLIFCKSYLEPFLMKRFKLKSIAIPIDILAIIVLTGISYAFDLSNTKQVQLIPKISAGFGGLPVVPRVDLWPKLFTSACLLAFICYAGTFSLQKLYARKNGYEVYPNQELFALGIANMVSSFFLCYPCAGSLARSAVLDKVGGRTQLASIVSSAFIFVFIMFLSPFLATLPKCALACTIIVALISTFRKFNEVFHYWKISKLDGLVWMATFLLVVFLGVDRGLLFGLAVGLTMMILRLAIPELNLKYHIPNSECYISDVPSNPLTTFKSPTPGVIIFEFHGPLIFINVERFKKRFQELVLSQIRIQINQNQLQILSLPITDSAPTKLVSVINLASGFNSPETEKYPSPKSEPFTHTVIFDMGQVSYLDGKAVECLLEIESELKSLKPVPRSIRLFLANISPPALDTMLRCQFFSKFDHKRLFLTVHDAFLTANNQHSSEGSCFNEKL